MKTDITAKMALDALKRLFPYEHGNLDVATVWAYLESQGGEENARPSTLKGIPPMPLREIGGRCRCGAFLPAVSEDETPPEYCSEECRMEALTMEEVSS